MTDHRREILTSDLEVIHVGEDGAMRRRLKGACCEDGNALNRK